MSKETLFNAPGLLYIEFSVETKELFRKALESFPKEKLENYREMNFTSSKLDISSRLLNDWDKKGVTIDTRDGAKSGWRRFSLFQWAHVEIVKALRDFGLAIESLTHLREAMETDVHHGLTLLETSFILTNSKTNGNIYLIIRRDGACNISRKREVIPMTAGMKSLDAHIELNLNQLWKEKFGTGTWSESVFMLDQYEIDAARFANHPEMKALVARLKAEEKNDTD